MENSKVKMQNGNKSEKNERLLNAIYGIPSSLSPKDRWLDQVCPVIKQNDFDTCSGSYSDGNYDICNGYNKAYNTYLDQFENC